jgi:hypothetical protein
MESFGTGPIQRGVDVAAEEDRMIRTYGKIGLRWCMGLIFLAYGIQKVIGGQFIFDHQGVTLNLDTVAPTTLVWFFYGYAPIYGMFIGMGECVVALLIMWRRTATVGALGFFAIALNIAVMDFSFGFPLPATLLAVGLTGASAFLLWTDRGLLRQLLQPSRPRPRSQSRAADTAGPDRI